MILRWPLIGLCLSTFALDYRATIWRQDYFTMFQFDG